MGINFDPDRFGPPDFHQQRPAGPGSVNGSKTCLRHLHGLRAGDGAERINVRFAP